MFYKKPITTDISSLMMLSSNLFRLDFFLTSSIPSKDSLANMKGKSYFFLVLFISLNRSHLSLASVANILLIYE